MFPSSAEQLSLMGLWPLDGTGLRRILKKTYNHLRILESITFTPSTFCLANHTGRFITISPFHLLHGTFILGIDLDTVSRRRWLGLGFPVSSVVFTLIDTAKGRHYDGDYRGTDMRLTCRIFATTNAYLSRTCVVDSFFRGIRYGMPLFMGWIPFYVVFYRRAEYAQPARSSSKR